MKRPSLLLINDDGIRAKGLRQLWEALHPFCDTLIVAPAIEQSGVGVGLTLRHPIHIEKFAWGTDVEAWQVTGTPADCVRMATCVIGNSPPDLIVSGINQGTNSGRNLLYSGTVGGVIEGVLRKIPGIAFSCEDFDNPQYERFSAQILPLVQYVLQHPLPAGSFLNVTFPSSSLELKGCRMARQGKSYFKEKIQKGIHPRGTPYYWMGGDQEEHEEHEESDVFLLKQGYTTAVPVQVEELTDHTLLCERKEHFNTLFTL